MVNPLMLRRLHKRQIDIRDKHIAALGQALAEMKEENVRLKSELAHIKIDHYFTRQESGLQPLYNEPNIVQESLGTRVDEFVKLQTLPDFIWGFEQHIAGMPKEKQKICIELLTHLIRELEGRG